MALTFHRDTVTRLRATVSADRYGDQVRDWSTPDTLDIPGCRVMPAAPVRSDQALTTVTERDELFRRRVLYAPADADLLATDRVRWGGEDYQVTGDVRRWDSPTGLLAHLEADLLRVEG